MNITSLQIQDLDTMQELTAEELSPVQGGLSIRKIDLPGLEKAPDVDLTTGRIAPIGRIAYPFPRPFPCYPLPPRPPICTNFPTKGGHLPWCAVIL